MTQRSGLSLQQLLNDRNLALQPCDSNESASNSSHMDEDISDSSLGTPIALGNSEQCHKTTVNERLINAYYVYSGVVAEAAVELETVSSARTRAMALDGNCSDSLEQMEHIDFEEIEPPSDNISLLKDVTAAADICRCNPCRCDPLLNDCSVSCNPVVEPENPSSASSPEGEKKGGCGCGCGSKKNASKAETRPPDRGCGCSCSSRPSPQENNSQEPPAAPVQLYQAQELPSVCSPPLDAAADPCCIVICLKHHFTRQYLMENRPNCCV